MSRHDPALGTDGVPKTFCDLTQSWSEVGGGVRTYLLHKRRHILESTPHRHLLIIPGAEDKVVEEGRATTVTIASRHIPGSPNYRMMLRNGAVRAALERFQPDLIECQDAYNLPWAAIAHRKAHPHVALAAAYMTDFPTVYVERPLGKFVGKRIAAALGRLCYRYCGQLYRRFDAVFALSENGGATKLRSLGIDPVDIIGLGVEVGEFGPDRRDEHVRRRLGLQPDQPLLIYVGRLDIEKRPDVVVEAFRRLPRDLGAKLVLIGEGPLREDIAALGDERIIMPGYLRDRAELAKWLGSADVYVSAMPNETFGVSIVEAQASGLPVVGVAAGAMIDRVSRETGRLGPVGDSAAMADNILDILAGDRSQLRRAACDTARKFSWDQSMEALFTRLYPAAFARRSGAAIAPPAVAPATLAKA
ncbi:glycosyltransferase [Sphingomonas lutea]|uniref:Glycosyltransferase n=1 Tax=Sphingomonas lutea TaxID=1045317 RepID=A0A7G9SJI4_9SPHN|nr:glycosyltransferase [Sphingomonas lutea]QNN68009.1 glycosyltransferase [Sphingomonas lutea]